MLRIDSPRSYLAVTSLAKLAVTRVRTYGRELAKRDGSDATAEPSAGRRAMFNETRLKTTSQIKGSDAKASGPSIVSEIPHPGQHGGKSTTHLVVATAHHGFRVQRVPPTLHSFVPSAPSPIIEHGPRTSRTTSRARSY